MAVEIVGSKEVIGDWTIYSWEVVTIFRMQEVKEENQRLRSKNLVENQKFEEEFSIYQTDNRQIDEYGRISWIRREWSQNQKQKLESAEA